MTNDTSLTSNLRNDKIKFILGALYSKCDIILVPNEKLTKWLIVDGELNSETREQIDHNRLIVSERLKRFKTIGLHRKETNEFFMSNNDIISYWKGVPHSTVYERVVETQPKQKGIVELIANPVMKVYNAFAGYYALDPWRMNEGSPTGVKYPGKSTPSKNKRDPKIIILTLNHCKFKMRNGISVMDIVTGRIFQSIAEVSRHFGKPYIPLWKSLWKNENPNLRIIQKTNRKHARECSMVK